jgi:hypothetical protein
MCVLARRRQERRRVNDRVERIAEKQRWAESVRGRLHDIVGNLKTH